jgi:hypothetical protein
VCEAESFFDEESWKEKNFAKDGKKETREKNLFLLLDNGTNRRRKLKHENLIFTILLIVLT